MDTIIPSQPILPGDAAGRGNAGRAAWRFVIGNTKVTVGVIIVAFFVLMALIGPFLLPHDPGAFSTDLLQAPSASHWLGTTQMGQDIVGQIVGGARISILVGFGGGLLATLISIIVGVAAGYFGGLLDDLLSLVMNIFLVLPGLPLAIVLAAFIPFKGPLSIALVLTVTGWAWGARVMRAQTLTLRNRDFVEAARLRGENPLRIIFAEILPNESAIVATQALNSVLHVILAEAGLEFLGLGNLSVTSWGTMFYWAQSNNALLQGAWWWFLPPGICIGLLGASLTLINFGIDEIANPRLRTATR